ncbi:hypothetical protein [Streptomyces uncialis]|uniref:hypothetical protein n=1 Tax=Streptomyces uncialis TaxID=1048205 RepID=UPI0022517EC8|nr:hypothetical protein [Streptomyces uncialis]MCX4664070.1 hypothetical protein [Streptomyces uncialis]
MRTRPITKRAAGILAVLPLVAAASAPAPTDPPTTLTLHPAHAPPGNEVELRLTGCPAAVAQAASPAFVAPATLAPAPDGPDLHGEARLRTGASPGPHGVTATCEGHRAARPVTVTVTARGTEPAPSPTAPVSAGGGGAAGPRGDGVTGTGPGLRQAVVGLLLAATAALAVSLRTRTRTRPRRPRPDRDATP